MLALAPTLEARNGNTLGNLSSVPPRGPPGLVATRATTRRDSAPLQREIQGGCSSNPRPPVFMGYGHGSKGRTPSEHPNPTKIDAAIDVKGAATPKD